MGRREKIIQLAVKENELKKALEEVQDELNDLLSNRKRGRKKKEKSLSLTPQQQELFSTGPLAMRVQGVLELHAGKALSVAEIIEMIRADNSNSVRGILSRLKKEGAVQSAGRGRYSVKRAEGNG